MDKRNVIAARVAEELRDGDIVNLGIGIPTLVVNHLSPEVEIHLHTENGILGLGPTPSKDEVDPDLVNAGKLPVTVTEGASFFDSATSFSMIRGGHIDVAILGALQVDQQGKLANWAIPGQSILGVGGAMDLLEGAKKIIVTMTHTSKNGESKVVEELSYPLTSHRTVDIIVTELAVFKVDEKGLLLTEVLGDNTIETIEENTEATFRIAEDLKEYVR